MCCLGEYQTHVHEIKQSSQTFKYFNKYKQNQHNSINTFYNNKHQGNTIHPWFELFHNNEHQLLRSIKTRGDNLRGCSLDVCILFGDARENTLRRRRAVSVSLNHL